MTDINYNFNTHKFENISKEYIERWKAAYPSLDIIKETLKAALWLESNPNKQKKNYARFLNNWFGRATRGWDDQPKTDNGTTKCRQCGKPFLPVRAANVYCSARCFEKFRNG
jgi:hypothetical protein